jgi:hypothetical protein
MPAAQRSFASGFPGWLSLGAINDLGRAKLLEVAGFLGTSRRCQHVPARLGQQRDRDGTDASGGAGDDGGTMRRGKAVALRSHERQHRRVAGGSDGHGLVGRETLGQRDQPVALDVGFSPKSAQMRLADAPAIENYWRRRA